MRQLTLVLVLLLSVAAFAQPWKQSGNVWTINGISVTIPAEYKAKADANHVLGAEGKSINMTFQPLPPKQDFASFSKASMKKLEVFKNIRWSEAQTGKDGDIAISMRVGKYTSKDVSLEFVLSLFERGKQRLATMTFQIAGHEPSSQVIARVMNSIQFR